MSPDIKGADARRTFRWESQYKGENVMYRFPQNIIYADNVIVKEDEYAVFFRDGNTHPAKVAQLFPYPVRQPIFSIDLLSNGVDLP